MNTEVNLATVRKTHTTPETRVVDRGKAAELIALMKEARKPIFDCRKRRLLFGGRNGVQEVY